jgi:hypothetical protein
MRITFSIFAALSILISSCGGGAAGPKETAEKFLTHINNLQFEEAKAYATEGTASLLDMVAGFAAMSDEKPESTAFEILDVTEDGDKATVTYKNEGAEEAETLTLVKQEGKWLVDFNKEDMNKEDEMGMEDDMGMEDMAMDSLSMGMDSLEVMVEETIEAIEAQ